MPSRSRICVSIGRTRHKMMLAEHRALAERGAELVELRIDWLQRNPDVPRLLAERPTPCIVTCRRKHDRGNWTGSEEQRRLLLRTAIAAGADYVDLEEDVARDVPRFGPTQRIVSHHDFDKTPDDLEAIHARLVAADADLVKLVTLAHSLRDAVRMLKLVAAAKFPTIGFCMGEFGLISRVLCGRFGSPLTYATFSRERELAPGQLAFDEMRQLYRYESIDAETELFGVIGDPIGHSLSPLLHNRAFAHEGRNAVYLPFRIGRADFDDVVPQLVSLGVKGFSVTIPHKQAALAWADRSTGLAADIGAANTLTLEADGRWEASNTDYAAALDSLLLGLRPKLDDDADAPATDATTPSATSPVAATEAGEFAGAHPLLHDRLVLVLGAGGAARAICLGLIRAGARVVISNRTMDRAAELAKELDCSAVSWENRGTTGAEAIVNCTPVGMSPAVDQSPLAANWLEPGTVVFDTIYNPENTLLLKDARERGCVTVSGIEMFVRQAARQYERFTGRPALLALLREAVRRSISPASFDDAAPETEAVPESETEPETDAEGM